MNHNQLTLLLPSLLQKDSEIKEMIDYNIKGGKNIRGNFFRKICEKLGKIQIRQIELGMFLLELMQGSFLLLDDMMDNSETRRGIPCWYKIKGKTAIFDGFLLIELFNNIVIQNYDFEIVSFTSRIILETILGQTLDSISGKISNILQNKFNKIKKTFKSNNNLSDARLNQIYIDHDNSILFIPDKKSNKLKFEDQKTLKDKKIDLSSLSKVDKMVLWENIEKFYNTEKYHVICTLKTARYTFFLPIKLAYLLSGIKSFENILMVCDKAGLIFQMTDDFINFFPEKSKKSETDLDEKKLTWFLAKIVKNGYDENVLKYFLSEKNFLYMKEKVDDLFTLFYTEKDQLVEFIKGERRKENDFVIDMVLSYFTDVNETFKISK